MLKYLSYILLAFALSGCATISSWRDKAALKAGYESKSRIEAQIADLRTQHQKDDEALSAAITKGKDAEIAAIRAQLMKATDGFFGADATYQLVGAHTRSETLVNDFVNEGWAALGHQMPDYQTVLAINARLKVALDETKTSLDQMKAEHDKVMGQNLALADKTKAAEAAAKAAEDAKVQTDKAYHDTLDKANDALHKVDDTNLALEHARGDNAAARQAMLTKASMILGGLALACLAGAIWSPVFKSQFGLGAAVLGFIALGIWYVTPFMIGIAGAVLLLALVGWVVWEHNTTAKSDLAHIQGLAEAADKQPAAMATIAPILASYQTKYVKAPDGTITTVPDPSIAAHVDARLMAVGDK